VRQFEQGTSLLQQLTMGGGMMSFTENRPKKDVKAEEKVKEDIVMPRPRTVPTHNMFQFLETKDDFDVEKQKIDDNEPNNATCFVGKWTKLEVNAVPGVNAEKIDARIAQAPTCQSEPSDKSGIAKAVLHYLGLARNSGGNLNALPESNGRWERIESIVDSGATVSVMNPEMGAEYEATASAASRAGVTYTVANGDELDNLGEKVLPVVTDEGTIRAVQPQLANVTASLTSVRQLYGSGHMVVFDGPESFIMNKTSGEINMIQDNGVNYTIGMWVIPKDELLALEQEMGISTNAAAEGFPWPAK
jgi:hypothetical protein